MNASSRLSSTGAGYPIRVPSIDIAEVGSGGGSIAWIDEEARYVSDHSAPAPVPALPVMAKGRRSRQ
jgi:N-methylhydantoinase A/oxoprolinase/acetone carboxylase beta subunit